MYQGGQHDFPERISPEGKVVSIFRVEDCILRSVEVLLEPQEYTTVDGIGIDGTHRVRAR